MKLYGPNFNHISLQRCFYCIFDPEVSICSDAFISLQDLHKDNYKKFPKFSKTYLLDKLELNIKSRCVFAWSGI